MRRWLVLGLAALMLAQPVAAQHGDEGDAALRRGLAYRGNGDAALAAHWLGVAATRGMPEAMFILANMLLDGEGVARNEPEARRLLEEAAQMDYAEAWQQLALMESDPVKAAQLMRRAAHALTHRGEVSR